MQGNTVLIVGGTGSLGRKLIDRWLPHNEVAVVSRDEAKHWTIRNEILAGETRSRARNLQFYVGDVRDKDRLAEIIRSYKPEIVVLAAALKQVDTCELSPSESVKTNLNGTQNIISMMAESRSAPRSVLLVSTDKACSPVNVYGMCKAMSERIVTSQARFNDRTRHLVVRYGNVLESRGSIIPLFKHQGMNSSYLTVTDPDMTRFVMTLDDSVDLIDRTLDEGTNGETWIPRLPSMRIGDLAEIFSHKHSKPIRIVGHRAGEKMHEDLINVSESPRARLHPTGNYYVVGPAFLAGQGQPFQYSSSDSVMTKEALAQHLRGVGVLDADLASFRGRSIEEIVTNSKE